MTRRGSPEDLSTRLEFHREGIAILPAPSDPKPGLALYVRQSRDGRRALRSCTCGVAGRRKNACAHLEELEAQVDACHEIWDNRSWGAVFAGSVWYRLARALCDGAPLPCDAVRAAHLPDGGFRLLSSDNLCLLRVLWLGSEATRLLERVGLGPRPIPALDRAQVLARLRLLQATPGEEAMNLMGAQTQGQAFDQSFWGRLAYHCAREHGLEGAAFEASVEEVSGGFWLTVHAADRVPRLRFSVPAERVEGVLDLLRPHPTRTTTDRFPAERASADLDDAFAAIPEPIPLRSLFNVSGTTEIDLDLRPQLEWLQAMGEARFLARHGGDRFQYGRLLFLEPLGLLSELEIPGRERRFAAPLRMELGRSRLRAFRDHEGASLEVQPAAASLGPRVLRDFDSIDITPEVAERSWYWLSVRYGFGSARVSLADVLRARDEGLPYLETSAGWVDVRALAAEMPALSVSGDRVRLSACDLLRLQGETGKPVRIEDGAGAPALNHLLALAPSRPLPPPPGLRSELRTYQKLGLDWLRFLFENGLSGLLCDDMGLGKTHQAMALLLALYEQMGVRQPFLVVCPTSVISHWKDKLARFAPGLTCHLYHGPGRSLDGAFAPGSVLVTSYGILRNDVERLKLQDLAVVVLDEVQHLKNRDTVAYQAAAELPAAMRLGLTGTPIENDLTEVKALFDLVLPGLLGADGAFKKRYVDADPRGRPAALAGLRRLLSPFVLRRLKTSVLDELPDKIEDVRSCRLSEEQVTLYREAIGSKAGPLVEKLRQRDQAIPFIHVFALLSLLKKICNHPALALGRLEEYPAMASGKWDLFQEVLEESLESEQKVVVFTQFLGMIAIMEKHLAGLGVGFATLTGSTVDRGRVVARFNEDAGCRVFLGSLKAGGTGIDLVAGSVVIHYDRWWNAAKEDQATDRVHRMGQKRAVQVFKLVTEGTLEEKIADIIERKRQLQDEVFEADEPHLAKAFTREELIEILGG